MKTSRTNVNQTHNLVLPAAPHQQNGLTAKSLPNLLWPRRVLQAGRTQLRHPRRQVTVHPCRHADLSFLTGNDLHKLRVEPLESNEGEYHSAHHNLTEVRKRYDEMKKERVALEEKIEKEKVILPPRRNKLENSTFSKQSTKSKSQRRSPRPSPWNNSSKGKNLCWS